MDLVPTSATGRMGFEEVQHTADYAIRVWGEDLRSLFIEAALGLNDVAGARAGAGTRISRRISLRDDDSESLLVRFLNELIFAQERERIAFDQFCLDVSADVLTGCIQGSRVTSLRRSIKAVTFHNLNIARAAQGLEVVLVFDV